ncbi:MAG: class I SAM-dependent methyltransferase [Burkholderiales bacterium]|uniref:class I SAM-dependent methyltransferase n=1 Tax=Comamonas granuli TaxID=290309 RepID=UPI0005AB247E|nr:class I SAM-dependent methyltransferase [Comamonas granuli]MCZ2406328.1 class I SAM-dependent methyltransferase [Burkholderiales bacterium]
MTSITSPPAPPAPGPDAPSAWVRRWAHLVPPGAPVLDLACGAGRHLRWFRAQGHPVTGVDRDPQAVQAAAREGEAIAADIENGAWPLAGRQFGGVVVTNYLWRPLQPAIVQCVAPGGVLIYETFAQGQETVGRPARPEFLLQPGELLRACTDLRTVAYEDGFVDAPARFVQRIAAVRPAAGAAGPLRYRLHS